MQEGRIYNGRIKEWWKPKAGFLVALLLFATLLGHTNLVNFTQVLLLSLITLTGIGVFGHLLNDWGDRAIDAIAGKSNRLIGKSTSSFLLLLFLALSLALLPWILLPKTRFSIILLGIELVLFFAYALPPFRLKNKLYMALVADASYAYIIPSLLAWHTYSLAFQNPSKLWVYASLLLWAGAIGLRHISYHHAADMENDALVNSPNIAGKYGKLRLNNFIKTVLLPLEFIGGCSFFFFSLGGFEKTGFLFLLVYIVSFGLFHSVRRAAFFPSHYLGKHFSDNFYRFWWSFLSLLLLTWKVPIYGLLILPIVFVFSNFNFSKLIEALSFFGKRLFSLSSSVVNYSIYYFRKYLLRWSEERNRGYYYQDWLLEQHKKECGTIALFNSNANKYTETFVRGHLSKLPYWIEFYYGDPIQFHYKEGNVMFPLGHLKLFDSSSQKISIQDQEQQLISDLQSKGVELLLCEFGTTAVQLTNISKKTGLPLIAIFYGYDAWHLSVIESHKENYKALFEQAKEIIGVSKDLCLQLEKLGCPKAKISYLPCYIDLELFQPKTKIPEKNIFLSVGRFAETKSPHLTILAFNEVLKSIPAAELRMVGKDGGGELFEACHILVKALDIADKVTFLGVLTPDEIAKEMQEARVFVQHSLTTPINGDKEGTPVAIMEAMASGMAIVSTAHAGIYELIENGKNGILVNEYDHIQMAAEMLRLCKNEELIKSLGQEAANSIVNNPLIFENLRHLKAIIEKYRAI
ncbi:MAG: colanic acid/amylovoran biosynthesis glycosyltransferase [Chitinophagales bacterium]